GRRPRPRPAGRGPGPGRRRRPAGGAGQPLRRRPDPAPHLRRGRRRNPSAGRRPGVRRSPVGGQGAPAAAVRAVGRPERGRAVSPHRMDFPWTNVMSTAPHIRIDSHRRYPYSAIDDRPTYEWPGGKRLAVHLSLNVEHFRFGGGIGNDYAVPQPGLNIRSYGWRDYGNRVGALRLLELADAYDFRYGLLVNSDVYAYCPGLIERFSARGHEIVGHGRTNSERQLDMSEEEETDCIRE